MSAAGSSDRPSRPLQVPRHASAQQAPAASGAPPLERRPPPLPRTPEATPVPGARAAAGGAASVGAARAQATPAPTADLPVQRAAVAARLTAVTRVAPPSVASTSAPALAPLVPQAPLASPASRAEPARAPAAARFLPNVSTVMAPLPPPPEGAAAPPTTSMLAQPVSSRAVAAAPPVSGPSAALAPLALVESSPGSVAPLLVGAQLGTGPSRSAAEVADLGDERDRAIEVVAMLGDSVIAVKHCARPARRGVPARAYFVVGALALVMSSLVFARSVHVASENHARRVAWVEQLHRPLSAFREEMLGPVHDLLGFSSLVLALGALAAGLWRRQRERSHPLFRIGTAPEVELPLAEAPSASFALVAARPDSLAVRVPRALGGELLRGGRVTPLSELITEGVARQSAEGLELSLPPRSQLRLRCGAATLLLSPVARPVAQLSALAPRADSRAFTYLAASAAAHVIALALLRATPVEAAIGSFDQVIDEPLSTALQQTQLEDKPEDGAAAELGGDGREGEAMAQPAGQVGTPDETAQHRRMAATPSSAPAPLTREQAIARARDAGVLGSAALREVSWTSLTGGDGSLSGLDDTIAYGDFVGSDVGDVGGRFGGARHGLGPGGDGGSDLIGTGGRYRTIGLGPGDGPYAAGACRPGSLCGLRERSRVNAVPPVTMCGAKGCSVTGGLDKAIVRRYIKRALPKITYCYEKQLLANPELQGTVEAAFLISVNGSVTSSTATGLSDEVNRCIAKVVADIAFPAAADLVEVHYPFVFRRSS